jgi:PhoH-like ATPase
VLEIEALCNIRGRSIPRWFFVLGEAQQLTPIEAKTVITRMPRAFTRRSGRVLLNF